MPYDAYVSMMLADGDPIHILKMLIEMKDTVVKNVNKSDLVLATGVVETLCKGDYSQDTSPLRAKYTTHSNGEQYVYIGIDFLMAFDNCEGSEFLYRKTVDEIRSGMMYKRNMAPNGEIFKLPNVGNNAFCIDYENNTVFIEHKL